MLQKMRFTLRPPAVKMLLLPLAKIITIHDKRGFFMKKQLFEDLLIANNNLSALLADALNIAEMQEQFHSGEPLTLALTLGKSTIH